MAATSSRRSQQQQVSGAAGQQQPPAPSPSPPPAAPASPPLSPDSPPRSPDMPPASQRHGPDSQPEGEAAPLPAFMPRPLSPPPGEAAALLSPSSSSLPPAPAPSSGSSSSSSSSNSISSGGSPADSPDTGTVGGGIGPGGPLSAVSGAFRELFEACRNGDVSRVRRLLEPGNVNAKDMAGRKSTPLHFAAGQSWGNLHSQGGLCTLRYAAAHKPDKYGRQYC
ncbi:poly [ADP-ribose] polymerase tankyrase-1-like [Pseudophryne corroboree]|uniref:poly [ADP-ribose] polymerase tankyrase-1-like n=1 Tax=Pseudophryne corroboree TaxID=495146 RepID=UPI003081D2E8